MLQGWTTPSGFIKSWCSHFLLVPDAPAPPSIHLNSHFLPNQTQKVLTAGSAFSLSCSGTGSVRWTTTAFRLLHDKLGDRIEVSKSTTRHTGTYSCGYTNQSLAHLDVWIHLYVNGRIGWGPAPSSWWWPVVWLLFLYILLTFPLPILLCQTRPTLTVYSKHLEWFVKQRSKRVRISYSDVFWRTLPSPTSPSNQWVTQVERARAYPLVWPWPLTLREERWSEACRGHSLDTMSVQVGRMEDSSDRSL